MGIKAEVHPDVINRLTKVRADLMVSEIVSMEKQDLLALQSTLGYGSEWGVWEIPLEWATPGRRIRSARTVLINSALPDHIKVCSDEASAIWVQVLRLGLLRALVLTERRSAAPATILQIVGSAARLAKVIATKPGEKDLFWGRLTVSEASNCLNRTAYNTMRSFMSKLHKRRLLVDCLQSPPKIKGVSPERNRHNEPAPNAWPTKRRTFQALPDAFVAQCGWRVLWLIQQLGPTLLDAMEAACNVPIPVSNSFAHGIRRLRARRRQRIVANENRDPVIASWKWATPSGKPITAVPFELAIKRRFGTRPGTGGSKPMFDWPPKTFAESMLLLNLLQTAHAWVLFLLAGPRISEVLSYNENCIVEVPASDDQRVEAQTYKPARASQGRKRDFPTPKIALTVVQQQVRLARFVKKALANPLDSADVDDHLWVVVSPVGGGQKGTPLDQWNKALQRLVTIFGLEPLLDRANPLVHTHRFRKTLARLVALTMVNATMMLMDCFGHEDPEMTLISYILSDKRIHADVIEIQKELVILLAVDTIKEADTLGGAGGEFIRKKVAERLIVLGKDSLEPQDAYQLAQDVTLQGRALAIVTPGVLCALPMGCTGPCSKKQGGRDPANCRPGCNHQILTEFNKVECDETIEYIVPLLEQAVKDDNELMIAYWQGQLRNSLYRWKDVCQKWESHPTIAAHVETWAQRMVAAA